VEAELAQTGGIPRLLDAAAQGGSVESAPEPVHEHEVVGSHELGSFLQAAQRYRCLFWGRDLACSA
jgi:hypothetical protein